MKMHTINHDYRAVLWCGIAALATISGRPTSECRQAVLAYRAKNYEARGYSPLDIKRHVMGMRSHEMIGALEVLGFTARGVANFLTQPTRQQPTLAAFLRKRKDRGELTVVNVTGHYVVVSARKFIDNHTRTPVPLSEARCRRSRVKAAWSVTRSGS